MQKTKNKILANLVFLVHWPICYILLFGWTFRGAWSFLYLVTLVVTLSTQLVFRCCLLTKWEFDLRKKLDPSLEYDHGFISWYAYKYVKIRIPSIVLDYISVIFLSLSLVIFLYGHG